MGPHLGICSSPSAYFFVHLSQAIRVCLERRGTLSLLSRVPAWEWVAAVAEAAEGAVAETAGAAQALQGERFLPNLLVQVRSVGARANPVP